MLDEFGDPLHLMIPRSRILVRISVQARRNMASPDIGVRLRNHLGLDFAATSATREGHAPGAMKAGETVTVDFHFEIPELYPGAFSFSPWVAEGSDGICDSIDNAITVQMARGDGPVYGYVQVPCRIELNRIRRQGKRSRTLSECLNLPVSASFRNWLTRTFLMNIWRATVSRNRLQRMEPASQFSMLAADRLWTAGIGGIGTAVTGTDISAEAVSMHVNGMAPGLAFLQLPARRCLSAAFDLVVAFEVIEHLDRWQELLAEANRVLKSSGVLLVSTPNRDYYAESRGEAGPNPFHRHEFDYDEFRRLLEAVFPYVRIWTQNHAEAIVFAPPERRFRGSGIVRLGRSGGSALLYGGMQPVAHRAPSFQ